MPAPQTAERQLINIEEGASRLCISRRMLWQLISTGALPVVQLGSKTIRLSVNDIEKFIDERRERRGSV